MLTKREAAKLVVGGSPTDEFRVSNLTHTSTLCNVKAGAAKKARAVRQRLGVVRIRSLRTMSSRRFYGSRRRNKEGLISSAKSQLSEGRPGYT